ncbi:hypothetical protein [Caballeronia sp. LZ032]|uniref:hypothetical protein n=1 Tax=Caballeronia sp. LZ032 TaxID=3038565 RepID=UPI00285DCC97|nr:hypothetical protein [Caballeronia sp. LZ032]MDR5884094.1 hypothetical protein [Caballeronia sp. LZ032]
MVRKEIATVDLVGVPFVVDAYELGEVIAQHEKTTQHLESTNNLRGDLASVTLVSNRAQTIWLRRDDGKEFRLVVGGVTIPHRTGHRLKAFYATRRGADKATLIAVQNLTTGETFDTVNEHQQLPALGFMAVPLVARLGAGLIVIGTGCVALFVGFVFAVASGASLMTTAAVIFFGINALILKQSFTATRRLNDGIKALASIVRGHARAAA